MAPSDENVGRGELDSPTPNFSTNMTAAEEQEMRDAVRPIPHSSQPASPTPSHARSHGRNRGHSLRRSLFAQNIQRRSGQSAQDNAFEMQHKSGSRSLDTQQASISIVDSNEEKDPKGLKDTNATPQLALYERWLANQSSRPSLKQRLTRSYRELRDRIAQARAIPPSVDGRHVKVNVLEAEKPIDPRTGKPYMNNLISSCRYTIWNFLPLQLVAQFSKLANLYFLIISILQMIPGLSTTGQFTTLAPLLVFVAISMAKEAYDDLRRHRMDKEDNEQNTLVLRSSSASGHGNADWVETKWKNVHVGDIVLLKKDTGVPADLVLLHAEDPTETAHVETKSLDGETNLKSKKPLLEVSKMCQTPDSAARLAAEFVVEDPNLDLYKFDGMVHINGLTLPLTNSEVLYRGCTLRNTPSAMGLVIYSGEECKIRMNANKNPRVKAPALQGKVNRIVIFVASLVFFIAIILTIAYQIWYNTFEEGSWYLEGARVAAGPSFTAFVIMLNTMLPLSLYVSLEIVKVAQIFFMNDIDMYDPDSDTPMEPHTSTINEELGQVSYIFSDKTGTLTNNSMKFRKVSIAGTSWLHDTDLQDETATATATSHGNLTHQGRDRRKDAKKPQKGTGRRSESSIRTGESPLIPVQSQRDSPTEEVQKPALATVSGRTQDLLNYISRRPQSIFAKKTRMFLLSLALCHTALPEFQEGDDQKHITYQASSPDELALVAAAQQLGYIVCDRTPTTITLRLRGNENDTEDRLETYEILDVIEFTSARKRMSILIRMPNGRICLFAKGADSTIRQLLRQSDLAAAKVSAVERRASQRRSIEAQQMIRRRSTRLSQRSSFGYDYSAGGRRSTDRPANNRESIDQWLAEREDEGGASYRRSVHVRSPDQATQLPSPRISTAYGGAASQSPPESPQSPVSLDQTEGLIDDNIAIDEGAVFERCFQHVDDYATEGLRTLLYGYRFLTDEEYRIWKEEYHAAETSLVDRQEKIERVAEMIETKLELVGATAIEDKLQKGVPDAIDRFRRAGIKMWMLTGDKRETAINIGVSCRLIKDFSTVIIIDHNLGELHKHLADAFSQMNDAQTAHSVMVVDGQTLTLIDAEPALNALFADVAIRADSVICCRASPSQKASLVKTIRTKVKGSVTLAIGDGANDIAMIQEAHLGIGIAGKEGLQAARTSDYSIAQFRFLVKLLLVHGRWNYIRVCKYTLCTFWKEMVFYLVQALYQRWNGYTGTSLYEQWSLAMFNTLFTSLPVIFMGVFEKDLQPATLLAVPELYAIGQHNLGFNFKLYALWATLGAVEAQIVYFIMWGIYGNAVFTLDNNLFAMGTLGFTACVIVINLKMQFIELQNKTATALFAIVVSVGGWFVWNLILSALYPADNEIYSVRDAFVTKFGRNPLWWITLLLIIICVMSLELIIKSIKTSFFPNDTEVFQVLEKNEDIRNRFEQAAADLLQQGWTRDNTASSDRPDRDATTQEEREAHVQELINRRRRSWGRRGSSTVAEDQEMQDVQRTPVDASDVFSRGFGRVRKGNESK